MKKLQIISYVSNVICYPFISQQKYTDNRFCFMPHTVTYIIYYILLIKNIIIFLLFPFYYLQPTTYFPSCLFSLAHFLSLFFFSLYQTKYKSPYYQFHPKGIILLMKIFFQGTKQHKLTQHYERMMAASKDCC